MNADNIFNRLRSLEKKEGDVLNSADKEIQAAKWLWILGMLILIITTGGTLPEELDAILHDEIFVLGGLICMLGLFLFNRVIGYVILAFSIFALMIYIANYYFIYYF